MKDLYYVQRLTEQIFLIRERQSEEAGMGPDDRLVRSFAIRHDAYLYVDSLNEKHSKADGDNKTLHIL